MKRPYMRLAIIPLLTSMAPFAAAQLVVLSGDVFLSDSFPAATVTVADMNGTHIRFKYSGVQPAEKGIPNFLIVIPSSGTTPAAVQIALNPNVTALLSPSSTYVLGFGFTTVDQTPTSTAGGLVTLKLLPQPPPSI